MSGLLEQHQKTEIRAEFDNIIIYEPRNEQLEELRKILQKAVNGDGNGFVNSEQTRYMIKTFTNIGDEIDEYTDEVLESKINNGDRTLKKVIRELKGICDEIAEDIQYQVYQEIEMQFNVLQASKAMSKTEQQAIKLGFESIEEMFEFTNPETSPERKQEILDRISKDKKKKPRKATNSPKKKN